MATKKVVAVEVDRRHGKYCDGTCNVRKSVENEREL